MKHCKWIVCLFIILAIINLQHGISKGSDIHTVVSPNDVVFLPQDEWKQVNANAAQSRSISRQITSPLKIEWKKILHSEYAQAVAYKDQIYLFDVDSLYALKVDNGNTSWTYNRKWTYIGYFIFSASSKGLIFFDHEKGLLRVLDYKDGLPKFSVELNANESSAVLSADNVLYLSLIRSSTDPKQETNLFGQVYTLSVNGQLNEYKKWYIPLKSQRMLSGFRPFHIAFNQPTKNVIMQGSSYIISLIDNPEGTIKGMRYIGGNIANPAILSNNLIYIQLNDSLLAMNLDMDIIWKYTFPTRLNIAKNRLKELIPLASSDKNIVVHDGRYLRCINALNGKLRWQALSVLPEYNTKYAPCIAGRTVFCIEKINKKQCISCYSIDTGAKISSFTSDYHLASLFAHNSALYVNATYQNIKQTKTFLLKLTGMYKSL